MRVTKLDGLRGIFSLMIVFYHYPVEYMPAPLYEFFVVRTALTFVDFFFVLSGFVIALNYHQLITTSEFKTYLRKRFVRLYPLLFYTSIIFLAYIVFSRTIVMRFYPDAFDSQEGVMSYLLPFFDSLLMTNSTPILGSGQGLNYPSWSISSEMISYIVFGIVMVYVLKRFQGVVLFVVMISCGLFLFWTGNFFASGDYGFMRGLIGFNLGFFVWKLSERDFRLPNFLEYLLPILVLGELFILYAWKDKGQAGVLFSIITIPLTFGISILTLLKTDGWLSRILDLKPIQYLGKVSYSIYLNHALVLTVCLKPVFMVLGLPQTSVVQSGMLLIVVGVTIVYSGLTYKYVEKKGGRFLNRIFQSS